MCADRTRIATCGSSSRIVRAASSPSVVWVGGMRMSTIAMSGRSLPHELDQAVGVARLTDDVVAPLAQQRGETLAKQHVVVGDGDPLRALRFRHTRGVYAVGAVLATGSAQIYRLAGSRSYRNIEPQVGRCPSGGRRSADGDPPVR